MRNLQNERARTTLSTVGLTLLVVGLLATVAWIPYAWRTEAQLAGIDSGRSGPSTGSVGSPDFVDRVVVLAQISPALLLAVLALGAGAGLRFIAVQLGRRETRAAPENGEPTEIDLH